MSCLWPSGWGMKQARRPHKMQIHRKHLPSSKKICDASNDKHTAETETARRLLTMGPLHAATSQKNVIIETWHGPFEASFHFQGVFYVFPSPTSAVAQDAGPRLCFDFFQTFVKWGSQHLIGSGAQWWRGEIATGMLQIGGRRSRNLICHELKLIELYKSYTAESKDYGLPVTPSPILIET